MKARVISRRLPAALLFLPVVLVPIVPSTPAAAAPAVPSLVARAMQNANSVRTLVHQDQSVLATPMGTVKTRGQSAEDEIHGRKHLHESISVAITGADGKLRTEQYTVELIFVPGLTYYRTSLAPRWARQKGTA